VNPMVWQPSGSLSGSQVLTYQRVLAVGGFLPRTAAALDGQPGPQTTAALRAYQVGKALSPTGTFDPPTLAALDDTLSQLIQSGVNINAMPGAIRAAVRGSHPVVAAIQTAATPSAPAQVVSVPPQVSQMLPPSTVAQLSTMPAPAVQSFVNDLVRKVETAENVVTSEGTGKDFTAVPMVQPDGTVVAAVQQVNTALQPAGWWAGLTPNERIGYGVGGAVVGVALIGGIFWLAKGKR